MHVAKPLGIVSLLLLAAACGSSENGHDGALPAKPEIPSNPILTPPVDDEAKKLAEQLEEKPWEVVSRKGETYLPNVFYADASQNEQIMPYALDGHVMIDRLVYPTLGNPNLYVKSDPSDEFTTVLRIEDEAMAHLTTSLEAVPGSTLSRLAVPNDPKNGFAFFLVSREARGENTEKPSAVSSGAGTGVYRIYPHEILVNPIPADMPAALKARKTVRFVFKQGAMAKVPPGLYDVRFEMRKDDALYRPREAPVFEYQYNAVRVFDSEPEEYSALNITDTQVALGALIESRTKEKLDAFVAYVNAATEPAVRKAMFVTFNGDLHNGGSPATVRPRSVSTIYNDEAKVIVAALKNLTLPIFLTAGNHDGLASMGHAPSVTALDPTDSLQQTVLDASPKAWPGFSITQYESFLADTQASDRLGGLHRDIVVGGFARSGAGKDFASTWKEVPRETRNIVLYDGFHQWQKTYGPLNFSWRFGKNFYVSLNSFELRQHRRTGWGMYSVNYGGGVSDAQMSWLDRELLRTKNDGSDVVLLAHHDPRGGHKGQDFGYYFEQLEYRSIWQSAINYLIGNVWNSLACKFPDWAIGSAQAESCIHDGLQEWMRPDEELDCAWTERTPEGRCDPALFDPAQGPNAKAYWFSGIELMKRISQNTHVRTVVFGHTHYNSLEVLQNGDQLLPGKLPVDAASIQKFAGLEIQNPIRGYAVAQESAPRVAEYDEHLLPFAPLAQRTSRFGTLYGKAVAGQRLLEGVSGKPRELVVLRLVSVADLTSQTYTRTNQTALGFTVLHVTKKDDGRAFQTPQINGATFYVNTGPARFDVGGAIDLDRTARLGARDAQNPVDQLYDW